MDSSITGWWVIPFKKAGLSVNSELLYVLLCLEVSKRMVYGSVQMSLPYLIHTHIKLEVLTEIFESDIVT